MKIKSFLIDKNKPILNNSELELFVRWANGRNTTKTQDFYGLGSEWFEFSKKHFKESKEFYSPESFHHEKGEISFLIKRTIDGNGLTIRPAVNSIQNTGYIIIELKMKMKENELVPVHYKEIVKDRVSLEQLGQFVQLGQLEQLPG